MNYTTDQVIEIVTKFLTTDVSAHHDIAPEEFKQYLLEKEKSELPILDQLIWVRDKTDSDWKGRYLSHFLRGYACCFADGLKSNEVTSSLLYKEWDEYSLNDPNL